jgi:hypothetical protein
LGGTAALGNPTLKSRIHAEKPSARSSRAVGTIGGVFCFHERCWLLSAGRIELVRTPSTRPFDGAIGDPVTGGLRILAFESDEDDRARRPKSDSSKDEETPTRLVRKKHASPGVGNALREAYQEALREDIPPEMLDLLGKLG